MSDYNVYVVFLNKAVDIEKKNRKHIYGLVRAVGNVSLRLENIVIQGEGNENGRLY